MSLRVVTNSELSTRKRCPREHFYSYRLGYRSLDEVEAFRFGTRWHRGMEFWWDGRGLDMAIEQAIVDCTDPYEAAKLRALLRGYDARWGGDVVADVVAVEREFRAPVVNPETGAPSRTFVLGGKLDVLMRRRFMEHKCLAGSSRIFDHASGRYWTIEQMCSSGRAPVVTAMNASGMLGTAQAMTPVAQPAQPTVRVQTREGRVLVTSGNHPFLTARGWMLAAELTEEDWLATPVHQHSQQSGSPLPNEAFRLAGYMIGDGCLSNMSFCKADESVLADVIACAQAVGETPKRFNSEDRVPTLRFSKTGPVAALLASMGIVGGAAQKRVPQIPMSDRQCAQIIAGLWSSDGCLDLYKGKKPRAIYTSVSERLCRDVQELLQRLGMSSSFNATSVPYNGDRREVFTVKIVSRASKHRFAKMAKDGRIPLSRSSVSLDEFVASIPDSNQASDASKQPSQNDGVWWDRVAKVEQGPEEVLYDLSVPGPHTFVAEGLITHNTTSEDIGFGSIYWRVLTMNSQVSTYYAGAKSLGHQIDGCIYDVVKKPSIRPSQVAYVDDDGVKIVHDADGNRVRTKDGKKWRQTGDTELGYVLQTRIETPEEYETRLTEDIAANPDKYYQRGEVVRLEAEEREAALDVWQITRAMREDELAGRHPRNADACKRYSSLCPYFAVCCGEATLEDASRYVRLENVHAELSADFA